MVKKISKMFIRFDMIHERDGQTDGQTLHDSKDCAYAFKQIKHKVNHSFKLGLATNTVIITKISSLCLYETCLLPSQNTVAFFVKYLSNGILLYYL